MIKYQVCIAGKLHQDSYSLRNKFFDSLSLDLIFADIWGPTLMKSAYHHRFYFLLVDDVTCYNWIFLITQKSQVLEVFILFKEAGGNIMW